MQRAVEEVQRLPDYSMKGEVILYTNNNNCYFYVQVQYQAKKR